MLLAKEVDADTETHASASLKTAHQSHDAVAHGDKAKAAAAGDLVKLQRHWQRQLRAPRQRRAPLQDAERYRCR